MLNAANLVLVTFDAVYADRLHGGRSSPCSSSRSRPPRSGVALAVVLLLFRRRGDVDLLAARDLGEPNDVRLAADVQGAAMSWLAGAAADVGDSPGRRGSS